jgi:hypothetical protein
MTRPQLVAMTIAVEIVAAIGGWIVIAVVTAG